MSVLSKIAKFATSPQGRKLTAQAKKMANDPETRRKIEETRERLTKKNKPR